MSVRHHDPVLDRAVVLSARPASRAVERSVDVRAAALAAAAADRTDMCALWFCGARL